MKTILGLLLVLAVPAGAAELDVMSSGGFASSYTALAPKFEAMSGDQLHIAWGPSMGDTADTIPSRLARGEPADVLVMVGAALDKLVADGRVLPGSATPVANSVIAMAVKAGVPVPDISTVDKLRAVLLAAKSVAYSDSASGVYIQNQMFKTLGIADQMAGKAHMIPAIPVGGVVARGEAEVGFQQLAELKPVPGITIVGPIPGPVQLVTLYSAGVAAKSRQPEEARKLIAYMASAQAAPVLVTEGLEPIGK